MTTSGILEVDADERWLQEPNLPPVIQRAASRLLNLEFVYQTLGINASAALAMGHILRCVDKVQSEKTVFLKRINLATIAGKTTRTISNWLNALEGAGLIKKAQGHQSWGDFTCCQLQLTPRAIALFALDQPLRTRAADARAQQEPENLGKTVRSEGLQAPSRKKISSAIKESAFGIQSSSMRNLGEGLLDEKNETGEEVAETSGEHGSQADSQRGWPKGPRKSPAARTCEQQRKRVKVPPDCQALLDCRISPYGIFALMGESRKKGKRLSDIVYTRLDAILTAKTPFAFVKHLIHDELDYAYLAKIQAYKDARAKDEKQQKALQEERRTSMVGNTYRLKSNPNKRFRVVCERQIEYHELVGKEWVYRHCLVGASQLQFLAQEGPFAELERQTQEVIQ